MTKITIEDLKKIDPSQFNQPPCLICGKTFRNNFYGLCMDCADINGVSNLFRDQDLYANVKILIKKKIFSITQLSGTNMPKEIIDRLKKESKPVKTKYYMRTEQTKMTVQEAYDEGTGYLSILAEEMRSWEESMSGAGTGLDQTHKYDLVSEAADSLETAYENLEIEIPEHYQSSEIMVTLFVDTKARWRQLSNATSLLESVKSFLEERVTNLENEDEKGKEEKEKDDLDESIQEMVDNLSSCLDELQNIEFPGMF